MFEPHMSDYDSIKQEMMVATPSKPARGLFEWMYGKPADADKVWADRDVMQDQQNYERFISRQPSPIIPFGKGFRTNVLGILRD